MDDRPGEKEERLDLENDENEGQQIEADGIGFPGRRGRRFDAALIGHPLGAGLVPPVTDKRDEGQEENGERDRNDQKQKKVPIVVHGPAVFPFPRLAEILND